MEKDYSSLTTYFGQNFDVDSHFQIAKINFTDAILFNAAITVNTYLLQYNTSLRNLEGHGRCLVHLFRQ